MSNTAKVCWCLSCMDENQLVTDVEFFHWSRPVFRLIVVLMFSRSCLLIRPISLLAGLNKSASGFVLKVGFMVLECYKSLSFGHTFCPVGNVQISGDVFGFVVNSVDCVSVGFLVGRCDAVHDQLVVRGFVHFVEVGCFVGRYKCFRRIVDFPDIML